LQYLHHELRVDQSARDTWYRHWIELGFEALETRLRKSGAGPFCYGNTPTMADCCLIPQVYNARRFDVDMEPFPTIGHIDEVCAALPAFDIASPEQQPDSEL